MDEEQLVLFRLGEEEYGIAIAQVKEIIQYKEVTRLPGTPDYMEGIINLRNKIVPIVDLAILLGLSVVNDDDRRAIIIEIEGRQIGIVVDAVTSVFRLNESAVEPPPTKTSRYVRGIGKAGTRKLILLDVDKLLDKEEIDELGKVG